MSRKLFPKELIPEFLEFYSRTKNLKEATIKFDATKACLWAIANKNGLNIPKAEAQSLIANPNIKTDCFDTPTRHSTYWLGYLLTDGYISENKANLSIELSHKDKYVLEEFREFVGLSNQVTDRQVKTKKGYSLASRIRFNNPIILKALSALSVENNKSCNEKLPPNEWQTNNFWRGVIDGDGTVAKETFHSCTVSLVGGEEICQGFIEYLNENNVLKTPRNVAKIDYTKIGRKFCSVTVTGPDAARALKLIYSDEHYGLRRKKDRADFWIDKYTKAGKI